MKTIYLIKALLAVLLLFTLSCKKEAEEEPGDKPKEVTVYFYSNTQTVYEGQSVTYTDLSTENPTKWEWTFEGGTPSVSNEQNPTVIYKTKGSFSTTLKVSNNTSSDEQTKPDYITVADHLLNGLVAYYKLDGDGADYSKHQNHGKVYGVIPVNDRFGNSNSAMFFNDSLSCIDIGDKPIFNLTTAISISVWINASEIQNGWGAIANKWYSINYHGNGYYLGINPDGLLLKWKVSRDYIESPTSIPTNEWVHIVTTYDSDSIKMYINNKLINKVPFTSNYFDNNVPFRIGSQSLMQVLDTGFHGAIDDLRLYNRVLTKDEIEELFNE